MRSVLFAAAVLALAAGCAGSSDDSNDAAKTAPDVVATVANGDLLEAGKVRVCSDLATPPLVFRGADGRPTGFEVELVGELARRLALRPVWVRSPRRRLVDDLASGRCDAAVGGLRVSYRLQGRIGEIGYAAVPLALLVRGAGAKGATSAALCGKRIAVVTLTGGAELVSDFADRCARDGRARPIVTSVASPSQAAAALRGGSVDAVLEDAPVADWFADHSGGRLARTLLEGQQIKYAVGYRLRRDSLFFGLRGALAGVHETAAARPLRARWRLERTLDFIPLP